MMTPEQQAELNARLSELTTAKEITGVHGRRRAALRRRRPARQRIG